MSTQTQNNQPQQPEEQEIDLIQTLQKLWFNRKRILRITGCFILLGLLIAIFSAKSYTASCEVIPQTNKNASNSSMARLASLAGINMGSLAQGELLSPLVYPNLLKNSEFQRELLQTQININDQPEPITLQAYLTDEQYQKFSLMGTVLKYTVGLPWVIMDAFRGEPKSKVEAPGKPSDAQIIMLTKDERKAVKKLSRIVGIKVDEKKGYLTIVSQMPEPYAAAQVAESTLRLLQKYVTNFKIEKVQSNLDFIQGRYNELKSEYEQVQMTRARFRDANMNTSTSRARTELERLDNQYQLAYGVFSEIATQLEQAKIQVKETTPVLTVINPVTVPIRKSKPQRMMILAGFTFFGLVAGCGYVLMGPFIRETFGKRKTEEEEV